MTDDPIFAEVSLALARYKFCLENTNYREWWHRFKCGFGEPEARQAEAALQEAKERAGKVVNATEAHRTALRITCSKQPCTFANWILSWRCASEIKVTEKRLSQ